MLQKDEVHRKGGGGDGVFPQKRGDSNPGGNYVEIAVSARKFVKKETLTQVFPCEFCEISKNTFF